MAVGVNIPRGGVEIHWEPGDYVGPVRIKAVNIENGDVGVMKDENDGKHFITWPPGTWSDHIVVYQDTSGQAPPPEEPSGPTEAPDSEGPVVNPLEFDPETATVIDEGDITVTVA